MNTTAFVGSLLESSSQSFQSTEVVTLVILLLCPLSFFLVGYWNTSSSLLKKHGNDVVLPPHVRSYIPYLGSAIEMGSNIRKFVAKYGERLKTPIFTATIAGDHCLFISDPDHVLMVYRYNKYLDDQALQKQFVQNVLGVDQKDEHIVFSDNPKPIQQFHKYLFTNEELQKTVLEAQKVFKELMTELAADEAGQNPNDQWHNYNLFSFVREYIFKASVGPLVSKFVANDEASDCFKLFDAGIPFLFAGAPSYLTKKATAARNTLLKLIRDPNFLEQGSDFFVARATLGYPEDVFARLNLGVLFGSVGNSIPAVFWVMYHLLEDPKVYEAAKAEVESIVKERNDTDARETFTLEELDRMVIIKSTFMEALRLYSGAFTTREAVEDFVFDPKKSAKSGQKRYLIQKGTRVMSFPATMHHDPDVFEDPESFQYDRFLPGKVFEKNGKSIVEPVRVFGGGLHLCPGRKFISYQIRAFIAMLVSKFEMRLSNEQSVPKINFPSQGVGISHPDHDVGFKIRVL